MTARWTCRVCGELAGGLHACPQPPDDQAVWEAQREAEAERQRQATAAMRERLKKARERGK